MFHIVFDILQLLISLEPIDRFQWSFLQNVAVKIVHTVSQKNENRIWPTSDWFCLITPNIMLDWRAGREIVKISCTDISKVLSDQCLNHTRYDEVIIQNVKFILKFLVIIKTMIQQNESVEEVLSKGYFQFTPLFYNLSVYIQDTVDTRQAC